MLKRALSPLHEFGIAAGSIYLLDRLLSTISPRLRIYLYELMVQPVSTEPLLSTRRAASLVIREIAPGEPALDLMPVRPDVMAARLAHHATCLGAFNTAGTLVGYLWFNYTEYDEDEVRCTYVLGQPDDSVFDFDFYLFPEYRMGTAFVALWNSAYVLFRKLGVRWTFSRMTRFNNASRRAHRRLGGRRIAQALFLKLGTVELMLATVAPYVHISAVRSNRVRLTLNPDDSTGRVAEPTIQSPSNPLPDRQ